LSPHLLSRYSSHDHSSMLLLLFVADARSDLRRPEKSVSMHHQPTPRQTWPTDSPRWYPHNRPHIRHGEKQPFVHHHLAWICLLIAIVLFLLTRKSSCARRRHGASDEAPLIYDNGANDFPGKTR
jgi:hypothetical protein